MEDSRRRPYAAYPLLVVGGHDAYMSGESGARFYPDRSMTRAEMAQVLYNLLAAKLAVTKSSFTDVRFRGLVLHGGQFPGTDGSAQRL